MRTCVTCVHPQVGAIEALWEAKVPGNIYRPTFWPEPKLGPPSLTKPRHAGAAAAVSSGNLSGSKDAFRMRGSRPYFFGIPEGYGPRAEKYASEI